MTMWIYLSVNCYYCTSSRRVYSLLRKLRATDLSCDTSGPLSLSNGSSYKSPFRLLVRWSLDFDAYKPSKKHYHLIVLPDGSGATVWLTLENRWDDLSQRNGSTVPAQRTVTTFHSTTFERLSSHWSARPAAHGRPAPRTRSPLLGPPPEWQVEKGGGVRAGSADEQVLWTKVRGLCPR